MIKILVLTGLLSIGVFGTTSERVPRPELVDAETGYHGLIREDELVVEVKPKIRAIGAEICGFRIVSRHHGETPFEIVLKDEERGEAELRAKRLLNCEKRKNYKFDIAAVSCVGDTSDNATVHITVVDVNEYAPTFLEPSYVKQVDEGRLYDLIIRVEATDRDCTAKFGDICKYEILTKDQPFEIDNDGVIRNTEPLDYDKSHNHILSVVAYDCGMKKSAPVMVTIKVSRVCKLGWKGIPERIDYAPGSSRQELFPEANLELCDVPCAINTIETKLQLSTIHIGKGCDRDTYGVHSQRKLCGASSESVDLLPTPGLGTEWTKNLPTDEGHESDPMFEFDGSSTAVVVPEGLVSHYPGDNFTIATWMKHDAHPEQDRHTKEHIVCNADDHKMNRHHFAVFVRNCRLILLLRREHADGDLNTFRPAEWRWKVPQVCDDEWHHYAVSVTFPDVQLYIDGLAVKQDKSNPEVIDDWPLHPAKGVNTSLSIGACWQGSENKFKHHFRGYLAGLSLLLGKMEDPGVLSCLHKCKESLEVPGMEVVQPGMQLMTNTDMTEITVEGENTTDIENLIRHVGYINSREFPTPGRRNLHLATKVICESGKTIKIIPSDSFVMVLPPQKPTIEINGTSNLPRDYEDFRLGVRVFSDVRITISSDRDDNEEWRNGEPVSVIERKLDACSVQVYPPLNPDHESITVPENMLSQLGIVEKITNDGILLSGADMIYNYEQVLRQIQYSNRKPAYYLNRAFKLICSELNGRFTSNEYVQTLTVIHPDMSKSTEDPYIMAEEPVHENDVAGPAHVQVEQHHMEMKQAHTMNEMYIPSSFLDGKGIAQKVGATHAVTVIIVVCVGFLLFMIVLGVIRIRAAHHRSQQDDMADAEMAWDDSALNITVNPMENLSGPGGPPAGQCDEGDESWDEDDDASSYHDDSSSDDDGGDEVRASHRPRPTQPQVHASPLPPSVPSTSGAKTGKELEWDHSSM
ncbi:calsyntenin-1 [Folsomia candida]|uniref:calsyntenin-1 n=1 Tax=Folsomia candida TaxID=158441 RepID=UPI000B8FC417|nr:calsyntenin-1 [Folsomia candida]